MVWGKWKFKTKKEKFLADVKSGIIPQTIWKHVDVGHTQEAKQQLKKILDASTDFLLHLSRYVLLIRF